MLYKLITTKRRLFIIVVIAFAVIVGFISFTLGKNITGENDGDYLPFFRTVWPHPNNDSWYELNKENDLRNDILRDEINQDTIQENYNNDYNYNYNNDY